MHPKLLLLLVGLCCYTQTQAQSTYPTLTSFNQTRQEINQAGMLILGSWAIGNIGVSAVQMKQASGPDYYFNQMNMYWNFVNLTLAGVGYYRMATHQSVTSTVFVPLKEQFGAEKVFLFNTGLDVVYVATGLYLTGRSYQVDAGRSQDRLRGFGHSILLQGGFLLLFDTGMFLIHHQHLNRTRKLFESIQFSGNSAGLVLKF